MTQPTPEQLAMLQTANHFRDLSVQIRGVFLEQVVHVEWLLGALVGTLITSDSEARKKISDHFLAKMSLGSKVETASRLAKEAKLSNVGDLWNRIRKLAELRNILAHAALDVSEPHLRLGASDDVRYNGTLDGKDFTVNATQIREQLGKCSTVLRDIYELMRQVDPTIPEGKILENPPREQ